jgi:hypothetical protein
MQHNKHESTDRACGDRRNRSLMLDLSAPARPDLPCEPQLSVHEPRNLQRNRTRGDGKVSSQGMTAALPRSFCFAARQAPIECGSPALVQGRRSSRDASRGTRARCRRTGRHQDCLAQRWSSPELPGPPSRPRPPGRAESCEVDAQPTVNADHSDVERDILDITRGQAVAGSIRSAGALSAQDSLGNLVRRDLGSTSGHTCSPRTASQLLRRCRTGRFPGAVA